MNEKSTQENLEVAAVAVQTPETTEGTKANTLKFVQTDAEVGGSEISENK